MKNYIFNKVEMLLRKYKTRNPFEICEALGIHVREINLNNLKGFYNIILRERYIFINSNLSEQEKLIVCAHELGHDRLHQHFARYTPLQDISLYDMTLKPEREANIFGVELLISDDDIISNKDYTAYEISSILGVSKDFVDIKLDVLAQRFTSPHFHNHSQKVH